jgi:hypothetical protein
VAKSPSGFAELKFQVNPNAKLPRFVDANRANIPVPPATREFNQVVVAIGQLQYPKEQGSWADLLQNVLAKARAAGSHFIRDSIGRVVGLQSAGGLLRVLGAAALSHPDVTREWRQIGSSSNLYLKSLVEQSRVEVGVALSGTLVAEANHYWQAGRRNNNLNMISSTELGLIWPALFPAAVRTWIEMRSTRIEPFTTAEITSVEKLTADRY